VLALRICSIVPIEQEKAGVSPIIGTEESVRKQLPDRLCSAVVRGSERADADVVIGIPGISGGYNPVSGKEVPRPRVSLKSE